MAWAQPPGFFPGGPPGMGGPPGGQERKLVKRFDKDGDKRLNAEERAAARAAMEQEGQGRRGFPMRPPGMRDSEPVKAGPKLTPVDVKTYGGEALYDMKTLRTIFLEFENTDWEKELMAFHNTDVEVPATVKVDGKVYRNVGVHFRGMTSFMMAPEGRKHSLNLSFDFVDKEQRLGGYRTLDLLNSAMDPTFLRTVLYMQAAREYIPAPKANYVRVAINGESWGIYVNTQHFNTDFVKEWFPKGGGARWKVPGSPMGRGGLDYIGEDLAAYNRVYEIKSKNDPKAWAALINLCRVLAQTPPDKLEEALTPILDVDGVLKFLALDNVLINNDGYWIRASDYSIYQDDAGKFHVTPHDANETWQPLEGGPGGGPGGPRMRRGGPPPGFGPGGPEGGRRPPEGDMPFGPPPGMGPGGPGGRGSEDVTLDPLAGADDPNKALLHRLLAVPALKQRYLGYVRQIATEWLDWKRLEPMVREYQALIASDVKADTRKLGTTEAFSAGVEGEVNGGFMSGPSMSLKTFVEKRREFLLRPAETKKAAR